MYSTSFSLCDRSVGVEVPDRLRPTMRALFGSRTGSTGAGSVRAGPIVVRERDDRFTLEAPFSQPVDDLGAHEVLPVLLDEVVRSLVYELDAGVALHAGAVAWRNGLILIAGPSQVGKTSLVAWLVSNGFAYGSDELVALSDDGQVEPFARPLVVKPGAGQAVARLSFCKSAKPVRVGENLIVAPRRRRNNPIGKVALVIFVRYGEGADLEIEALGPARCITRLMECNLNARNLHDDGLESLQRFAASTPAISLRYGAFEQLGGVVDRIVRMIVAEGWQPADTRRFLSAFGTPAAHLPKSQAAPGVPKVFPIPAPTERRLERKLTIGMATYDDFDGVYFTIQALRLFHGEVMDDVEFLVIDNHPDGPCGEALKALDQWIDSYRYVPFIDRTGTIIKQAVFDYAAGNYVLCLDCHVLIAPGAVRRLIEYYDGNPETPDLLQGPLIYDDLGRVSTHFEPVWRSGMYGRFCDSSEKVDIGAEPFEIPMQGMGLFSCRKAVWPGFNPEFSGFGGEEFYIHEKFRQAGARTLCLPFLRWLHRFGRPMGVTYPNKWEDRIRNYLIGFAELGVPTAEMEEHFREMLGAGVATRIFDQVRRELLLSGKRAAT